MWPFRIPWTSPGRCSSTPPRRATCDGRLMRRDRSADHAPVALVAGLKVCMTFILSIVLAAAGPISQRAAPQSLSSVAARRVPILAAEDRRAPTAGDLATIRAGVHSGDATTVRIAIRALGRLERPELMADIVPGLRHPLPEVRAEAANAIAQAAEGWTHEA